MLLSRVAEGVYWAGRYAERAEATARLAFLPDSPCRDSLLQLAAFAVSRSY